MRLSTAQTLKTFWNHTRRYKMVLVLAITGFTLGALGDLLYPQITRAVLDAMSSREATRSSLTHLLAWLAALLALNWLGWRLATYSIVQLESKVMTDLDLTCFQSLHEHSARFFSDNFVGSLVKKVNRYSRAFEAITDRLLFNVFTISFRVLGALVILATLSPMIAASLLIWLVLYIAIVYALTLYKLRFDIETVNADTRCTGLLADSITNAVNIKLFDGHDRELERYSEARHHQRRWRERSWNFSTHLETAQATLSFVLELAIFYQGLRLWEQGRLSIGEFALIQGLVVMVLMRIWDVSRVIKDIYRALADAEEMTEILALERELVDAPGASELVVGAGRVDIRRATFGYGERRVFEGFELSIRGGEKLALIGPSGSGKSTLTKLLLRLFELGAGAIEVDGQDIATVTRGSLRRAIAFVPQEPVLFHRPLLENIRYGRPDATDTEVHEAARLARCHGFIARLQQGYDTLVGERGIKLSGGERQRIAIARAILKDAPILILDEATSSLDSESEAEIQAALECLMAGRTSLVIAHRLSTIVRMDRIVVLEDGEQVEEGTHAGLLAERGLYHRLWGLQAGGFLNEPMVREAA